MKDTAQKKQVRHIRANTGNHKQHEFGFCKKTKGMQFYIPSG